MNRSPDVERPAQVSSGLSGVQPGAFEPTMRLWGCVWIRLFARGAIAASSRILDSRFSGTSPAKVSIAVNSQASFPRGDCVV